MTDIENRALQRQRQRAESLRSSRSLERRSFSVRSCEVRDGAGEGEPIRFSGYPSLTETPYTVGDFTEPIQRGAFKRTLKENPDVVFRVEHQGLPLARTERPDSTSPGTLRLEETERGLKVDAEFDPEDPDAIQLRRKMLNGLVDEMSFASRCNDDEWSKDWSERTVKSVTLHGGDVSAVTFGASPTTGATTSIRSAEYETELRGKYVAHVIAEMGSKGEAFGPAADGHWSFPVGDRDDLEKAIHMVGLSGSSHNAVRVYLMGRAKALGLSHLIPLNWASDGWARSAQLSDHVTRAQEQELEVLASAGKARAAERARRGKRAVEESMEECSTCSDTGGTELGGGKCEACGGTGKVPKVRRPLRAHAGLYLPRRAGFAPSRRQRRELAFRHYMLG
jgi:HK97 family phage prohead protease